LAYSSVTIGKLVGRVKDGGGTSVAGSREKGDGEDVLGGLKMGRALNGLSGSNPKQQKRIHRISKSTQ